MKGPVNDKGETAGVPPIPNSGEAHAGWFQGKINAMYNSDLLSKPNRYCDKVFKEAYFKDIDFTKYYENEALRERFGKLKTGIKHGIFGKGLMIRMVRLGIHVGNGSSIHVGRRLRNISLRGRRW